MTALLVGSLLCSAVVLAVGFDICRRTPLSPAPTPEPALPLLCAKICNQHGAPTTYVAADGAEELLYMILMALEIEGVALLDAEKARKGQR